MAVHGGNMQPVQTHGGHQPNHDNHGGGGVMADSTAERA